MTDQIKVDELHDEDSDLVEVSLEEKAEAPKATGASDKDQEVSEPESVDSVDKAADATKQTSLPKTKGAMLSAMYKKMNGMKSKDLQASYSKLMGEDAVVDGELVSEEIDTTAELDALVESEATLSEEFKQKTAILFETALQSKLVEEIERMEEEYKEELSEEVASIKSDLVSKVDGYLNYVVESWLEDNKLAVQNGLRNDISENFMDKLKDLFVESYIEVPESKVDLVDELAAQVEELEEKLNEQTGASLEMLEEMEKLQRESVIREACADMAETQVEKLKSLVEKIDFDDMDSFSEKVSTVKESYFSKEVKESVEMGIEEAEDTVEVSTSMSQYINAIKKSAPKT